MTGQQIVTKAQIPAITAPRPKRRTPIEKAAAVLSLLDEKTLEALSGRLKPEYREKLLSAITSLKAVPIAEQRRIAHEFAARFKVQRNAVRGSEETAKRVGLAVYDDEDDNNGPQTAELDEMLAQLNQTPMWEKVGHLPIKKLISFFGEKSATVLSIAMRLLPEEVASELAGSLDDVLIRESILLIATTRAPNPLAIEAVEKMVEGALLTVSEDDDGTDDGSNPNADKVAGILNRMTNTRREKVLEVLKETLPGDEMGDIAGKVLSFEALEYRLPRNAIPVIFREVAEKEILMALKYALAQKDPVAEYLLGNISQRMATGYREQMEKMAAIDDEEGEQSQSTVICKVLEIVDQGRIELLEVEKEKPVEKEKAD